MARGTGRRGVPPGERKTGRVVFEPERRPQLLPGSRCVAVLAFGLEVAVRALHFRSLRGIGRRSGVDRLKSGRGQGRDPKDGAHAESDESGSCRHDWVPPWPGVGSAWQARQAVGTGR